MQLPAMLTFNELNGEEIKEVLHNRFDQIMNGVPYFQRTRSPYQLGGNRPPDRIREMHGLPISKPTHGRAEIGGQIVIADQYSKLDGQEVEGMPGLKVSRTGTGSIDGMPTSSNATVAKIDQGPAGLRQGEMRRDAWHFGRK